MARILICDDDVAYLDVLERELSAQGHEVVPAADGYEACEKAEAWAPDLILLNEDLPVFNGFETCQRLRSDPAFTCVPILLLVEDDPNPYAVERAGLTDVMPKNLSSGELREVVVRHLGPLAGSSE
jgi:CheY-like chemotaxis protein